MSRRKGRTATPKVQRPRVELEDALRRRVRFLEQSARSFDEGDPDEALRMSVELRALLHYGSSPPLLHQLGLIKRIQFVSSIQPRTQEAANKTIWAGGLTVLQVLPDEHGSMSGRVVAHCMARQQTADMMVRRSYTPWWKSDLVVASEDAKWHTRRFVVTEMGNTEATHTDTWLDGDYDALRLRATQWQVGADGQPNRTVMSDVSAASVRQIAWEVLETLHSECSELL